MAVPRFFRRLRAKRNRLLVVLAAALAMCVGGWLLWEHGRPALREVWGVEQVRARRDVLLAAAREARVDPYLLAGMMFAESSGRVNARSSKGALGLFQLMPATAAERAAVLGLPPPSEEQLLSDALLNARLGANYLRWLLDRSEGDPERALVAYNTGPTRLAGWIRSAGGYEEWRAERLEAGNSDVLAYATKVLRYRDDYRSLGLLE